MKWTVTKKYFRGNVGVSEMDSEYNFKIGEKVGPKKLWEKLNGVESGWEFHKGDDEYTFTNHHIDNNGNSWGRSEVVLTYLDFRTVFDDLNEWLKEGEEFSIWWNDDEFSVIAQFPNEDNCVNAEDVIETVEDYIYYNFSEEVVDIVAQGVPVQIDGELICNNPYASPKFSLNWKSNDKEFRIIVQSPSEIGEGFMPFEGELVVEKIK